MKNLGSFDPKAVELFEANFSENFKFSEDTESYDFTTCQRPDGSFYGTGGQCRKGKESGAKADVESMKKKRQELAGKIVDAALKQDMETMRKLKAEGLALDKKIIAAGGHMEGRVREQKNRGREKAQLGAKGAKAAAARSNKEGAKEKTSKPPTGGYNRDNPKDLGALTEKQKVQGITDGYLQRSSPTGPVTLTPRGAKSGFYKGEQPTREQAQARRRAATVTALRGAGLPTNPPAYERALNKRLKARPEHAEAASALKSADKAAVQAQRNLRKAEEPLRKKGGANATPEEKAAYKAAQQEARAANTAYEKARRAEKKLRDEEARKLSNEVRAVADRAKREARAKEPVVGTEMGGKKRLGDADITTSPRD
jgi:hypothetical protein